MVTRGEGWERETDWEFGMDRYTLLYFKWITNQDLLYSTGNSAQYHQPKWEKNLKKNRYMYMYN